MRKYIKNIGWLLLIVATQNLVANDAPSLSKQCTACHGSKGISANSLWPNLAGQKAQYLANQLRLFKSGERIDPQMSIFARNLNDSDIEVLANYYANLPSASQQKPKKAIVAINTRAFCISCHGVKGISVNPEWPNIAGQNKAYLEKQLLDYQSGKRIHPLMNQIASEIDRQQIKAIADYYSKL